MDEQAAGQGEVLLHALLMVPDGKDLSCGPFLQPPNVYLNCKLFGSDETARSVVSWGQTNPTFSFTQVSEASLRAYFYGGDLTHNRMFCVVVYYMRSGCWLLSLLMLILGSGFD